MIGGEGAQAPDRADGCGRGGQRQNGCFGFGDGHLRSSVFVLLYNCIVEQR